jgi:hypothetical protein
MKRALFDATNIGKETERAKITYPCRLTQLVITTGLNSSSEKFSGISITICDVEERLRSMA